MPFVGYGAEDDEWHWEEDILKTAPKEVDELKRARADSGAAHLCGVAGPAVCIRTLTVRKQCGDDGRGGYNKSPRGRRSPRLRSRARSAGTDGQNNQGATLTDQRVITVRDVATQEGLSIGFDTSELRDEISAWASRCSQ